VVSMACCMAGFSGLLLAGCGTTLPNGVIVRVGHLSITKQALEHQVAVEKATLGVGDGSAQAMREKALTYLIGADWLLSEASDRGLAVPGAAVQAQSDKVRKQRFPTMAAFKSFLASSGQSMSEFQFASKLELLAEKLEQFSQAQQGGPTGFEASYEKSWRAKTDCRRGYVAPGCKQYKRAPKSAASAQEVASALKPPAVTPPPPPSSAP
jgi:hypothetical protein